jgi:sugar transferase EpsL
MPPIKRALDLFLVIPGLILLVPLFLLISILVAICMGFPILFRQKRPGLRGKPFEIFKFRTMIDARDAEGTHLTDSERLTCFGRLLRNISLDELPEFINVIKGDMSIVGPRPLLMQYISRYTQEQSRRHDVKPGITGWAQVNGRNAITWEEKFCLDIWYVDHWSLWLDLKIIAMTIITGIKREGINHPGHATMSEFMGSKSAR